MATWILTGSPDNFEATRERGFRLIGAKEARVKLAKPSVACVACDEPPGKECGELLWLLTPQWFGEAPPGDGPLLYARNG